MMVDNIIDAATRKSFDDLTELSKRDREELITLYPNREIRESIKTSVKQLLDDAVDLDTICPSDFPDLIYLLADTKRSWSRYLGKAIILETREAESGDLQSAANILEDFIKNCPSPFHRNMANKRLGDYKRE